MSVEKEYKGNHIDMHPKEVSDYLSDFVKNYSDEESKLISFNVEIKFLDKTRTVHAIKDYKLNANSTR